MKYLWYNAGKPGESFKSSLEVRHCYDILTALILGDFLKLNFGSAVIFPNILNRYFTSIFNRQKHIESQQYNIRATFKEAILTLIFKLLMAILGWALGPVSQFETIRKSVLSVIKTWNLNANITFTYCKICKSGKLEKQQTTPL